MGKIDIKKILETEDKDAALVALKRARQLAWDGEIVALMDMLTPESSLTYEVYDTKLGRMVTKKH